MLVVVNCVIVAFLAVIASATVIVTDGFWEVDTPKATPSEFVYTVPLVIVVSPPIVAPTNGLPPGVRTVNL